MTVTRLGIMRGSRRAKITDGDLLRREFIETHILTSDTGNDDEGHVYAAMDTDGYDIGDPWTGEGGSTNPGTYVTSVTISDHDQTKKRWEVEVEYSSELPDNANRSTNGSNVPIDWEPTIEWDTEFIEEEAVLDNAGNPVTLGNDEKPNYPPIVKYIPIASLRYGRFATSFTSTLITQYSGKTNSDVFLGYPPNCALCMGVSATAHFIYGLQYWRVNFLIKFDVRDIPDPFKQGWRGRTLAIGTTFRRAAADDPVSVIIHKEGRTTIGLNKDGTIHPGPPKEETFDIYKSTPFAGIL